jgi:hypothetical protein
MPSTIPIGNRIPHTNACMLICASAQLAGGTYVDIHDPVEGDLGVDFRRVVVFVCEGWGVSEPKAR